MLATRARRLQRGRRLRREPRASVGGRCAAGRATTAGGGRGVGPRLPRGVGGRGRGGRGGHGGRGRAPARGERPPSSPGLGSRAAGGKAATPSRSFGVSANPLPLRPGRPRARVSVRARLHAPSSRAFSARPAQLLGRPLPPPRLQQVSSARRAPFSPHRVPA